MARNTGEHRPTTRPILEEDLRASRWRAISKLIDEALDRPEVEREPFLRRACGEDEALRAEVMELLAACVTPAPKLAFLDRPASECFAGIIPSAEATDRYTGLPDLSGVIAGDQYRFTQLIGRGGMAEVYLADDLRHHRPVAIKVLYPDLATTLGSDRFLREIAFAAGLGHPHIVPVFDSGQLRSRPYYV